MLAFQAGRPVRLRNPDAIRPWQFVLEPLNGYLTLAERLWADGPALAGAWNFGPDDGDMQSVAWLTDALAARWGEGAGRETDAARHPHETTVLKLDCRHAREALGWRPVQPLGETLDRIVEWYRACFAGEDMRALTLDQIQRFQERASHG
jgi:CDP-glucose 4,6-dehydratase